MKKRELSIELLKEWIKTARYTPKTRFLRALSVVDFYRFLYSNREPRCKKYYARGCIHGYKKHFYRWGHDVWNPWVHANSSELGTFLYSFAIAGCGIILHFKLKEGM